MEEKNNRGIREQLGIYTLHPFYGSRKMVTHLRIKGYSINRKRVQRLMRILGLAGMAPGKVAMGSDQVNILNCRNIYLINNGFKGLNSYFQGKYCIYHLMMLA
jgi:hypothetical protein